MVVNQDLLRVWDNILIYGFGFVGKFGQGLLSKYEPTLINLIKEAIKTLAVGSSVDALIIAGNIAKNRLLERVTKIPLEKILKKCQSKPNYKALKRSSFVIPAQNFERDHIERLHSLRHCKQHFMSKNLNFQLSKCLEYFEALTVLDKNGFIERKTFVSNFLTKFNWSSALSLSFFRTFDQDGNDCIQTEHMKCGFSILSDGSIDEKLQLFFIAQDKFDSKYLTIAAIGSLLSAIETSLDNRSSFFILKPLSSYTGFQLNDDSKVGLNEFLHFIKSDPSSSSLIDFLEAIDTAELGQIPQIGKKKD